MITKEQAYEYSQQLHPAFAGYLHDGMVSQRDAVACIMHMLQKGSLYPIFQEGNMQKNIVMVGLGKPGEYEFEKKIQNSLFSGVRKEITTKEIGNKIKYGTIQEIITNNVEVISKFKIINQELDFKLGKAKAVIKVNGEKVDTIEEFQRYKGINTIVALAVVIPNIIILFVMRDSIRFSNSSILFYIAAFIFTLMLPYILKKKVNYEFRDKIEPLALQKYTYLYEYMKNYPLRKHTFTNEFLAHAIAFGLDDSWYKDFGLRKEDEIDFGPLSQD